MTSTSAVEMVHTEKCKGTKRRTGEAKGEAASKRRQREKEQIEDSGVSSEFQLITNKFYVIL